MQHLIVGPIGGGRVLQLGLDRQDFGRRGIRSIRRDDAVVGRRGSVNYIAGRAFGSLVFRVRMLYDLRENIT